MQLFIGARSGSVCLNNFPRFISEFRAGCEAVIRGTPKVSSYAARFICGKAAPYFSYGVSRSRLECGRCAFYQAG